eukprot:3023262-Karenia_brevis.AAC.1
MCIRDRVYADELEVKIQIYGQQVAAASAFKYLGVTVDEFGSEQAHVHARIAAFQRAVQAFKRGLWHLPSYSHSFLLYLWCSLVTPVVLYGLCLFNVSQSLLQLIADAERKAWRELLHLGGRAPTDCVRYCWGEHSCLIEARVQRAALFIRLLNSPVGSWEH